MRLPEAPLFDTDEANIHANSLPTLGRAAEVLKRSMRPI